MNVHEILEKVGENNDFEVGFTKKDGTFRKMSARRAVVTPLKGVGKKFNPTDKNQIIVWDNEKQDYRTISVSTLKYLKIKGEMYETSN